MQCYAATWNRRIPDATWWTAVFTALDRFSDAHVGSLVIITAEGDPLNEDDHLDSFKTSQWAMVSPRDSVLARNHSAKNVRLLGLCVRCQSRQTNLKASEQAITNEAEQSFDEASTRNSSVPAEGTVFSVGQDQKISGATTEWEVENSNDNTTELLRTFFKISKHSTHRVGFDTSQISSREPSKEKGTRKYPFRREHGDRQNDRVGEPSLHLPRHHELHG